MAWNFILAIYNSRWDLLITNNNNVSFRNKIAVKFTLKINRVNTNKSKNNNNTNKPTAFNKLLPPIPAKLLKKVNEIAKYFKKNN